VSTKPLAMQLLTRKVDGMGNVPRLLLVFDHCGNAHEMVEIDYGNIPLEYRDVVRLPDMQLTNRDYRDWLDMLKARRASLRNKENA
jgi:hypothetical protein